MSKGDLASYPPRFRLVMDDLAIFRDSSSDIKLVRIALNGFIRLG